MSIRPKGRTQCIFPRPNIAVRMYINIYSPKVNLYQVVFGLQSVRTLFKSFAQLFGIFLFKMAAGSHFGCPKITLYHISYHFRSIPQFLFCEFVLQNGCRWLFCMSENHFRWHFCPFRIYTKLFNFFYKMAAVGHFKCPKFTLDHISGHFRSIQTF